MENSGGHARFVLLILSIDPIAIADIPDGVLRGIATRLNCS